MPYGSFSLFDALMRMHILSRDSRPALPAPHEMRQRESRLVTHRMHEWKVRRRQQLRASRRTNPPHFQHPRQLDAVD